MYLVGTDGTDYFEHFQVYSTALPGRRLFWLALSGIYPSSIAYSSKLPEFSDKDPCLLTIHF